MPVSLEEAAAIPGQRESIQEVEDERVHVGFNHVHSCDGDRNCVERLMELVVVSVDVGVQEEVDVCGQELVVNVLQQKRFSLFFNVPIR